MLQGDHKNRQGKVEYAQKLDPSYWVNHGGSSALIEHYEGKDTNVEPACGFCHSLLDSHDIYHRSSTAMPGTDAYRNKTYRLEKQLYVNNYKIAKKMCEHPECCDPRNGSPRIITMDNVHAFHCAHINDIDKEFTISKMVKASRPLASVREELDSELHKCKIYCANCHHKARPLTHWSHHIADAAPPTLSVRHSAPHERGPGAPRRAPRPRRARRRPGVRSVRVETC